MDSVDIDALLEAGLKKPKEPEKVDSKEDDKKKSDEKDGRDSRKRTKSRSRSPHDDRDRKRRSRSPRDRHSRDRDRRHGRSHSRDRRSAKDIERDKEREKLKERERRDREREKEREQEALLDPLEREQIERDRDERTVLVTNMPLRAYEDDITKFFEQAGKVRDIRLITDRNSRKSKGFGYVEFYDRDSVRAALSLSGRPMMNQTVSVQPSQAEKNRTGASSLTTTYFGPTRLYVGSLNFNTTAEDIKEAFVKFGSIEFVDLHKDPETGRSKGFAFVQFRKAEEAKRALQKSNGMELGGRTIKVNLVNEPVLQAVKASLDDDENSGGVKLNAVDRVLLMSKLQRPGPTGGVSPLPQIKPAAPAAPVVSSPCVLLKNMFDPAEETGDNWHKEIEEDVSAECKKFGSVLHIFVDKDSLGHIYLKFGSIPAAQNAINALNGRWFSRKQISASFVPEGQYYSKFPDAMAK